MNNLIKSLMFIIVCLFCSAEKIIACDCGIMPMKEAIKKSTAVFSAKVVDFEYRKGIPNDYMNEESKETGARVEYETLVVKFLVKQWWKGEIPAEVYLVTSRTKNADGTSTRSSCDYTFQEGEDYLIFATGKESEYRTSYCSRTKTLTQAKKDLKILGEGKKPIQNESAPNR